MTWPWLLWWRHRHEWKENALKAEVELETSKRLLREDQAKVAIIARAHRKNQFSEIIRDALEVGYHHPPKTTRRGEGS